MTLSASSSVPIRAIRGQTSSVSIIVAGRNSAEWIGEALRSALTQSHPCEVIYADDCSTDGTLSIARSYEAHGLRVSTSPKHGGVCAARNRGAALATGDHLCFLDADDILPPDYIASHVAAMVPGCPFVYGAALAFGGGPYDGRLWQAMPFEQWDRWSYNTVNTSALYSRWAFEKAGRWVDGPTMWDHDLALRASRLGTAPPRVSAAVLHYRQHPGSFSNSVNEKADDLVEIREVIRRRLARLSVATIYSGRLPELFAQWIERVAQSVRYAGLRPDLTIAFDPRAIATLPAIQTAAAVWSASFTTITFVELPSLREVSDETDRRNAVATWLAGASQRLREIARGDLLWLVEDDILVPRAACRELWSVATSGVRPPEIVSGVYRSRHAPTLLIAGRIQRDGQGRLSHPEATELPTGSPVEMDFVGTGCVMLWTDRPALPKVWPSHVAGTDPPIPAHDWALSIATKRAGGQVLWHPGVKCGHAQTASGVFWP